MAVSWSGGKDSCLAWLRAALAREVIERGIVARLVCVDTAHVPASLCGQTYDDALLARLPPAVCLCGEDGEFHTAVTFAPGMAHAVALQESGQVLIDAALPLATMRLAQLVWN
jgi:diphthamide synthase (EF-2-diphthine--ammonia ligase)